MKRAFAIGCLTVLLVGCGGTTGDDTACVDQYWDGTVGTCLPAGWTVVTREKLDERGLPPEVIAAFERSEAVAGQVPVVLVTRETLPQPVEAAAYSEASIRSVTTLPGYTLVDSRNQEIDGQTVQIHIYTAQPQPEEPARRFYQLSTVYDGAGYTFTGLSPFSVERGLESEILTMLRNATLTEPTTEE